jgi:hypothetical protein
MLEDAVNKLDEKIREIINNIDTIVPVGTDVYTK